MFCDLALPHVREISPYIPGKPIDELQRELGLKRISKLASNENPLGASPKAVTAIQSQLSEIARYPDGSAYYLKQALSKQLNLSANALAIGNGSNELLELIARVFAGSGDEIIYSQYAFAVYPICAQVVGAKGIEVSAKNWGHDLPAMLNAITNKTKIIYLANPNNPTGTLFEKAEWEAFISKVPENVIVVLDEAYFEYVNNPLYANGMDYLETYPNLLVSRTFSKAYGLASLRVGYLAGCEEIIGYINQVREPFNVNHYALVAATAAVQDQSFVQKSVQANAIGMEQLVQGFEQLGLDYIPSFGNFICVSFADKSVSAAAINDALLKQGVIVRPVANYQMHDHLRISVGLSQENKHFLQVMTALKAQYGF